MEEARYRHPSGRAGAVILGAFRAALPRVFERAVLACGWLYSVYMLMVFGGSWMISSWLLRWLRSAWLDFFVVLLSCSTCWFTWALWFSRHALRAQDLACAGCRSVYSCCFSLPVRAVYTWFPYALSSYPMWTSGMFLSTSRMEKFVDDPMPLCPC